jgi:beta-lactam-binding protein with PASTA domain/tetratricopeptide (TPR) repeat protein
VLEGVVAAAGSQGEGGTVLAGKKQEVTVTARGLAKQEAPAGLISKAITWSNDVIIESHQSYTAQSITPNFPDSDARAQAFRRARLNAALTSDPLSYKELGDALLDMGDGAKALDAYEHIFKIAHPTPEFLTNLGEAYRFVGDFQQAENTLNRALNLNSNWAPALNALGNVYMDQAGVERDKRNYDVARAMLEKAKGEYTSASQSSHHQTSRGLSGSASGPRFEKGIVQSNLGEVYRAFGDIAQDQGHGRDALAQYQAAEQTFKQAQESSPRYAFAHTGLGSVYREINKVAAARGDKAGAADAFQRSQTEYTKAYNQHEDLAPAYVGLGNLYENAGGKEAALKFYTTATQLRPEEPTGHYHLALMLAKDNPRLAAAHAHTYLSVERKPLRQGERAQKARRVSAEDGGRGTVEPQRVGVPDVTNKDLKEAESILQKLRLGYDIGNQKGDYVVSQDPKASTLVDQGSNVRLTLRTRDGGGGTPDRRIRVPDVSNRGIMEAIGILQQQQLGCDIGDQKGDYVVSQDPKAGTLVDQGSNVRLTLRTRDDTRRISVPDVRNKGLKEAESILRQHQLGYDIGDQKGDYVVSQNPKPGTLVDQGSNVRLTLVSKFTGVGGGLIRALKRVSVPDVSNKDLQEAIGILKQHQLDYDIGDQKGNYVVNQDPKHGTLVEPGRKVHLVLVYKPGE